MSAEAMMDAPPAWTRFQRADGRTDVKSLDLPQLERWSRDVLGEGPFRARQLWKGLWQRGARTWDEMTHLSAERRHRLAEVAFLRVLEPERVLRSADGTVKYLWKLHDGRTVESVLIPEAGRTTLCMSSQVGCAMACAFCLTGDLGLIRHLTPAEIADQALQARLDLPPGQRITNLVFMGMGEPVHNLEHLVTALHICLDDDALGFSHRRITVSTVGHVDRMKQLAARVPVNLAVSLNASTDAQRDRIMPINRRWNIAALLDACRELALPSGKRISFEYVLFDGFNDSLEDAERVVALMRDQKAKVNLIPYNENPDRDLRPPPPERVKAFQHHLVSHGVHCTVRTTRGRDISAACGQLGKARQQVALGTVPA